MRFELDRSFERELMRSDFVRDLLDEKAREVAAAARPLAPDDPATTTKDLPSSISGEAVLTEDGWVGRASAGNFKAAWYEKGASGVTARPFLVPALERVVGPVESIPDSRE